MNFRTSLPKENPEFLSLKPNPLVDAMIAQNSRKKSEKLIADHLPLSLKGSSEGF
jgi:hypothetical protein